MVTASGVPPSRISSGSSAATVSGRVVCTGPRMRSTGVRLVTRPTGRTVPTRSDLRCRRGPAAAVHRRRAGRRQGGPAGRPGQAAAARSAAARCSPPCWPPSPTPSSGSSSDRRSRSRAGVRLVREQPPGGGPVAALRAGLAEVPTDVVALLAGDLPFLTARAGRRAPGAADRRRRARRRRRRPRPVPARASGGRRRCARPRPTSHGPTSAAPGARAARRHAGTARRSRRARPRRGPTATPPPTSPGPARRPGSRRRPPPPPPSPAARRPCSRASRAPRTDDAALASTFRAGERTPLNQRRRLAALLVACRCSSRPAAPVGTTARRRPRPAARTSAARTTTPESTPTSRPAAPTDEEPPAAHRLPRRHLRRRRAGAGRVQPPTRRADAASRGSGLRRTTGYTRLVIDLTSHGVPAWTARYTEASGPGGGPVEIEGDGLPAGGAADRRRLRRPGPVATPSPRPDRSPRRRRPGSSRGPRRC